MIDSQIPVPQNGGRLRAADDNNTLAHRHQNVLLRPSRCKDFHQRRGPHARHEDENVDVSGEQLFTEGKNLPIFL